MEYINDFKTQALNDIFDRHNNEPEIMKNSDHRHQGVVKINLFHQHQNSNSHLQLEIQLLE